MTPAEHKAEAEGLMKLFTDTAVEHAKDCTPDVQLQLTWMLQAAQVHATLATVFDETLDLPEPIE